MGRESEAIDEFVRVLSTHPSSALAADAEFWLGEYYNLRGRFDKAREYYYAIPKDFPTSDLIEKALYQAALTSLAEGKSEEAIAKIDEVASKFADS